MNNNMLNHCVTNKEFSIFNPIIYMVYIYVYSSCVLHLKTLIVAFPFTPIFCIIFSVSGSKTCQMINYALYIYIQNTICSLTVKAGYREDAGVLIFVFSFQITPSVFLRHGIYMFIFGKHNK